MSQCVPSSLTGGNAMIGRPLRFNQQRSNTIPQACILPDFAAAITFCTISESAELA